MAKRVSAGQNVRARVTFKHMGEGEDFQLSFGVCPAGLLPAGTRFPFQDPDSRCRFVAENRRFYVTESQGWLKSGPYDIIGPLPDTEPGRDNKLDAFIILQVFRSGKWKTVDTFWDDDIYVREDIVEESEYKGLTATFA